MIRTFTGWHMTSLLFGFFAIVISVNMIMARMARQTFSGVVVENSYVASQNYNRWLAAADRQARLGWTHELTFTQGRRVDISLSHQNQTLPIDAAFGVAVHPLGKNTTVNLKFRKGHDGHMLSEQSLPPGRWRVRVTLRSNGKAFVIDEPLS